MRPVFAAARRRSFFSRATSWARRHPLLLRGLVVFGGVVGAWACEYATSAPAVAVCRLRGQLQEKLGGVLEEALHPKGGAG